MKCKVIALKPKQVVDYTGYKKACDDGVQFVTVVAVGIIGMLSLLMWTILQGIK